MTRTRHWPIWPALGMAMIVVAGVGVAYPLWWQYRSNEGGAALMRKALAPPSAAAGHGGLGTGAGTSLSAGSGPGARAIARAGLKAIPGAGLTSGCTANQHRLDTPTNARPGVVEIPSIGLEAPVVQGLGNAVLDVAVGHDPVTVWPGQHGESVLLAHDVSYFSNIDALRRGDTVIWQVGCAQIVFKVVATEVAKPGARLAVPATGSGLALVTCWPTDALFWTSQRYIVETTRVG